MTDNSKALLDRYMRDAGYPSHPTTSAPPRPPVIEATPAPIVMTEVVERVREPTGEEVFQRFVTMARADPAYLQRLAHVFNYEKPFNRPTSAKPFPIKAVTTIEVSIAPAKPSKAKRPRADQWPHPFKMSIQAQTPKNNRVSEPAWEGAAFIGTPDRIESDADRLARQKSILPPHREFIGEVIEMARANDYLLGMVRTESHGDGSPMVGMTAVIVQRDQVEALEVTTATAILHRDGDVTTMIRLPAFDTQTSTGKPLSGGFRLQCRATRSSDLRGKWATGLIEFIK